MKQGFFAGLPARLHAEAPRRVAIPMANDEACAYAVGRGVELGVLTALLIGPKAAIAEMYRPVLGSDRVTVVDCADPKEACRQAVAAVREGRADLLMKGLIDTSLLLKAVLDSKDGLKAKDLLSHLSFFELPGGEGLKVLSDAAINIAPGVDELVKIVENAVEGWRRFHDRPAKVALLAANEKVSDKVPATVNAAEAAKRLAGRAELVVTGPISLDLAVSRTSCAIKGFKGAVAGDADVFIVPRLETGNVFYKSLQYFVRAPMGGLVYGAKCPVVLTSRADDNDTKLNSLLLGLALAGAAGLGAPGKAGEASA